MRLTIQAFVTLDGVMQGPGGADEDRSNGFEAGGWLVPFADEEFGAVVDGWFRSADAVLLGRTTFQLMGGFWPQVADPDDPVAAVLDQGREYVVSGSLGDPEWGDTVVLPAAGRVGDKSRRSDQKRREIRMRRVPDTGISLIWDTPGSRPAPAPATARGASSRRCHPGGRP